VALAGSAAIVGFGGVLALTAGLLIIAGIIGWGIAAALRVGAGASLPPRRRTAIAAALAGIGVVIGQVGIWLYASTEGGVLSLPDYLAQTFGVLVPAQLVIAIAVAWWSAR
jgi:hypothetical protein